MSTVVTLTGSLFLFCIFALSVSVYGQETISTIETDIGTLKSKLDDKTLDSKSRKQFLQQIASLLNHAGEIRFGNAEYEQATKSFVEADAFLKQYHEIYFNDVKEELRQSEEQLAAFKSNVNQNNRELLISTYRDLVRYQLDSAISETRYFGDKEAHKLYLKRLREIAVESGNLGGEAEYYEKLGQLEFDSDNNEAAFELFGKALELRRKAGKGEHWSLDSIAKAYWYLGEYEKAVDGFKQTADQTRLLNKKEVIFEPGATDLHNQSLLLERSVIRMTLIQATINIAHIYTAQGKYGAATEALKEAQKVIEQQKTDEARADDSFRSVLTVSRASSEATAAKLQGRLSEARGDEAAAIKNYNGAANIFSQLSGGNPSGAVAGLRSRLALIYSGQGKFDDARANILESMRIRARLHQESSVTLGLMQASRIELAAKKTDAALKLARQAKSSALVLSLDDVLAEANEVEADALLAKATDAGSLLLEQAILGYRTAIENYRKGEFRPLLIRSLISLGSAYERAGKTKEAETAYKEAVEIAESVRTSFSTAAESESYSNRKDVIDLYRRLVDLLVRQGRAEDALQYATRAQRSDLVDAVPRHEIKLEGKGSDALRQVNAAEQRVQAATTNLNNGRGASSSPAVAGKNSLATAVGAARQDYALAIKRLETEQPNLRFTVRPTDLIKLQATLSPTEAIVSYLVTADRLYIFVVRRNAVAVRTVEITQNNLRSLVASTRAGLQAFSADFYELSSDAETGFATEKSRADLRTDDKSEHFKKNLAPIKRSLEALHEKLISPIDDLVEDAATLKIIPNAELFLLPFSALIAPKDNKYLLEKHDLIFLTAGDLITVPSRVSPAGLLVAFGDPTEANLDGALEEVKAIQKVFPRSQLFLEDKATKEQLFKLTSAKILHFATHGHIRTPLELSTIQLARLPKLDSPDLSYGEIYALPLESSDMIVLSACETALGGVSGTEVGVFVEAFRTKTSTVAASLWSVDDFATRELMVEFYKNLAAGQTRSAAMRTAQLKLLHDGRTKNPLFWAAFVMYGDGGRLTGIAAPTRKAGTK